MGPDYQWRLLAGRHHRQSRPTMPNPTLPGAPRVSGPPRQLRADQIRAMVSAGHSLDRIGAELGITCHAYLRRSVKAAVPGIVIPTRAAVAVAVAGDFADRDATVKALLPDFSLGQIADRLGLTRSQIAASVKRLRACGAVAPASANTPRRRNGGRRAGVKVHVERNARILALHSGGATVEAIMAETGLSREVIKRVVKRSGDSIRNDRSTVPALLLSQLPDLVAKGMTGQQIADLWGRKLSYVYALASRAKVPLNGTLRAHNSGTVTPRVAARRKQIAAMITAGMTHAKMLEILKINQSTLSYDIKAAGVSGTSAYTLSRRKGRDAERRAA